MQLAVESKHLCSYKQSGDWSAADRLRISPSRGAEPQLSRNPATCSVGTKLDLIAPDQAGLQACHASLEDIPGFRIVLGNKEGFCT